MIPNFNIQLKDILCALNRDPQNTANVWLPQSIALMNSNGSGDLSTLRQCVGKYACIVKAGMNSTLVDITGTYTTSISTINSVTPGPGFWTPGFEGVGWDMKAYSAVEFTRAVTPIDFGDTYTGDFTAELFGNMLYTVTNKPNRIFTSFGTGTGNTFLRIGYSGGYRSELYINGTNIFNFSATQVNLTGTSGTLNHFCLVRKGNVFSFYVNGTRRGTATPTGTIIVPWKSFKINDTVEPGLNSWISEFRLSKVALYDPAKSTLTVPTTKWS